MLILYMSYIGVDKIIKWFKSNIYEVRGEQTSKSAGNTGY